LLSLLTALLNFLLFYFNAAYKKAFNELKKRLIFVLLLAYFYLKQLLKPEINIFNDIIVAIYSQKQPDRK